MGYGQLVIVVFIYVFFFFFFFFFLVFIPAIWSRQFLLGSLILFDQILRRPDVTSLVASYD